MAGTILKFPATWGAAPSDGYVVTESGVVILEQFEAANAVLGTVNVTDEITLNGAGRIRRRVTNAADADTHYAVTTLDVLNIGASTGVRTYTIDDTGADVGSELEIVNWTTDAHVVKNSSGGTIATMATLSGIVPGLGVFRWCSNGASTGWHLVAS